VCNASKEFNDFNSMIKLMQFLMGLDSVYHHVRTHLLIKEVLPSVKEAFAIVSREESHRNSGNGGKKSQTIGFTTKVTQFNELNKKVGKSSNQNLKCTHCNKTGHSIDKRFEIIGYPSWMKPRGTQGKRAVVSNNTNANSSDVPVTTLTNDQLVKLLSLLDDKSSEGVHNCNVSGNL